MNQLVYSPFRTLDGLHQEIGRLFNDQQFGQTTTSYDEGNWSPNVDIKEEADKFKVLADIPGVDPKDIDITLDRNILTIRGERFIESETEDKGFKRRERVSGSFVRQFTLPDTTNSEAITAKVNKGVLELTIPKGEEHKPLSIRVDG